MSKRKGVPRGKSVRRQDKNGQTYFVDRESGRRVSREAWEAEQKRLRKRRERERVARETEAKRKPAKPSPPRTPTKPGSPPAPPAPPAPGVVPPFPPGVSEPGYPIDDDGEYLDDAFAIEGEDET